MESPREFLFSKACVWGLIGSCALLALVGVLGMFTPDGAFLGLGRTAWCVAALALVMAFAIINVNTMAEAAMHAIDRRAISDWHWPTLIPAIVCGVGFAVASNIGVHLGWEILAASAAHPEHLPSTAQVDAIFFFVAAAKPLATLAVAGRQAMDRARIETERAADQARRDAIEAERRANAHAAELARIKASKPTDAEPEPAHESTAEIRSISAGPGQGNRPGGPVQRTKPRTPIANAAKAAAVGLTIMGGGQMAAAGPSATAAHETSAATTTAWAAMTPVEQEARRAVAKKRIKAGERPGPVSRATLVPLSSCKRYAQAA